MSVSENPARGQACLVFRRKGKLIEAVGRRLARWEEVECQYRRGGGGGTRRRNHPLAGQGAGGDVSPLPRGATHRLLYATITPVLAGDRLSLGFRCLVIGGHEAVAD